MIFVLSRQNDSWMDRGKTNDSFFKISQSREPRDVSPIYKPGTEEKRGQAYSRSTNVIVRSATGVVFPRGA